jgi:hypothetical protein
MQFMSQSTEYVIALVPWAAFLLAIVICWAIGLRDRPQRSRPAPATRRAATRTSEPG